MVDAIFEYTLLYNCDQKPNHNITNADTATNNNNNNNDDNNIIHL